MRLLSVRSLLVAASVCVAASLLPVTPALAGVVVLSNLTNNSTGSDTVNYQSWTGDAFLTDGQSWRLNSVTLDMSSGTSGAGFYFVAIYSDNMGEPGSPLETLTGNPDPYIAGQYTYTAAGAGLLLNPNTKYWVVQGLSSSVSGTGSYKTKYTSNSNETGDWSLPASGYQGYLTPGNSWDVLDFDYRKFEITATSNAAVPEPSTWALGLLGSALVAGVARRRRQRTTAC